MNHEAALALQADLYAQMVEATQRALLAERRIEELEAETPRERAARKKAEAEKRRD
jgi:hypothetical protein